MAATLVSFLDRPAKTRRDCVRLRCRRGRITDRCCAVALILGFARLLTYTSGLVFSLLLWGAAEGFGGPYGQGSIDVGVAIIYAVMFGALLALDYNQSPGPLTVDGYLSKRLTWWHWIVDVGTPGPPADADAHPPSNKPARTGHKSTRRALPVEPGWCHLTSRARAASRAAPSLAD